MKSYETGLLQQSNWRLIDIIKTFMVGLSNFVCGVRIS